jgi:hypothetical protein
MSTLSMQTLPLSNNAPQQDPDTVDGVGIDQSSFVCDPVVRNIYSSDLSGSLSSLSGGNYYTIGDYGPYDDDGESDDSA